MAQNLLTYNAKVSSIEQVYFSPVAVVPPAINVPLSSLYCFLSKVDPWPVDSAPPAPTQDIKYIKQTFKNMFVAKNITSNDISPVLQRIDWTSGFTYDYYRDDVDMFAQNPDGSLVLNFYVRNRYDQVFKCLWNGNNMPSTMEPYFEPGTFNSNNIFTGADGYKWKYIYTIDSGLKLKFMDANWIPVPVGYNTPNPLVTAAGIGNIDVINVINGGQNYDPANAIITVTVTGDGTGAAGYASVSNTGVITDIVVTNTGTNYTYANVAITSALGSGAVANAYTSPIGGHGFDPISELGAAHVMMSVEFNGPEGGAIPTDIVYHQIGLVINPTTLQLNPNPANGSIYKTTTDLIVAAGFGLYQNDEKVYQGNSLDTATFVGTVLSFDPAADVIKLINTTGTLTTNAPIFGNSSKTTRTLLSYSTPNFVIQSGYMSYIENRSGITRSFDGIEQFKIVLGY